MKITAQQRFETYGNFLNSDQGMLFVKDFLELTGTFEQTFVPNDPLTSAFNEGRRAAGRLLMGILNQTPDMLAKASQQAREMALLEQLQEQENSFYE